jgi:hypothetical protein
MIRRINKKVLVLTIHKIFIFSPPLSSFFCHLLSAAHRPSSMSHSSLSIVLCRLSPFPSYLSRLLSFVFCPLPTAYCLLSSAFRLLPIASCLSPLAFCLLVHRQLFIVLCPSSSVVSQKFVYLKCHSCGSRNPVLNGSLLSQGRSLDSHLRGNDTLETLSMN